MNGDRPKSGSVILYPYLWRWQETRGETEGRKHRPVCLVLSQREEARDITHLVLLAISSQAPRDPQRALAIPDTEKRRAGLAEWKSAWITVSEYNYDIAERSFYFEPSQPPLGAFSGKFLGRIAAAFRPTLVQRSARIDRTKT
jgi:hypothetical protein